nr:hypothetical protein BdHM001_32150 [Bdellovibrio sp. HM001]
MSRLSELIASIKNKDPQMGAELESEFREHASRLAFGLNFERHRPEVVELPSRAVRKGDKVRKLSLRGEKSKSDPRVWLVKKISEVKNKKIALIEIIEKKQVVSEEVPVDDLVVIAEFRDYLYPGLVSTGKVERGGDKPFHTVINGENYHVLKALTYSHRGKVDAIYIDPPYNTGAKDWKYNNDYVESDDLYRHSKWLAFMERRLFLAKELLNPECSVLIVSIDEKEYLRLGLLLEQTFPEAKMEMVTSVISGKGVARFGQFSRVEEYIFTLRFGSQEVALGEVNMLDDSRSASAKIGESIDWLGLRRREPTARRGARPKQFYPVFVDVKTGYIHSVGDEITDDIDRMTVRTPKGTFAVWPLLPDGTEGLWGITPDTARTYLNGGYLRARNYKPETKKVAIQYLPSGTVAAIKSGDIEVVGKDEDGSVIASYKSAKGVIPKRVWNMPSHNAETGGTALLSKLIPNRRFPFPKSLFAVEDTLRFFVADKPNAIVVDFFSGSGTSAHAVMRLNKQDNGKRQCICITNNEVGADEQKELRDKKLRPGDEAWEKWGICNYITKPRVEAAITGKTPDGKKIVGDYKFTDEFPMSDGFEENAEFFDLTYETSIAVSHNLAFSRVAPLLWMRAGSQGKRINTIPKSGYEVVDSYGLLVDLDKATDFCKEIRKTESVRVAYIVTNDDRRFQIIIKRLPESVEPVRLYESYLKNFEITGGE